MPDQNQQKQPEKAVEPVQAPAVPVPAAPAIESDFQLLAKIMLQREARLAAKEQQEENARLAREAQRQKNAESHYNDAADNQSRCRHLKGGKLRRATQAKDFAVYLHTYINAERVIKCQLCGAKWKIRDTKEYLFRYGKKVPNHTGIGWQEALEMLAQTSNQPSSSEIPMNATPQSTTAEV
jgi:hypothetical protein